MNYGDDFILFKNVFYLQDALIKTNICLLDSHKYLNL